MCRYLRRREFLTTTSFKNNLTMNLQQQRDMVEQWLALSPQEVPGSLPGLGAFCVAVCVRLFVASRHHRDGSDTSVFPADAKKGGE